MSAPPSSFIQRAQNFVFSKDFVNTAVTPWNPLLFGCHAVNEVAQLGQAFRWTNYWYFGGHERAIANAPKTEEPVAAPVKKE
ncbi:hypothetical protein DV451_000557 [Geotrichum candidum]|uniref:Mitochondrial pyruvate carrier n=1 Tax=Geotrichum candidum TaxID=1173061 RepID=A0A9P5KWC3_GEOCN|nr:hypothetical protein DV451_000557 [Geotrichum candidum]KAF5108805.1 hypothetical protein DV453_001974 [Geotrichum candidum]KAF5117844.1 hypothetical protein DV452_002219 [Geotrichum candidum]